MKCKFKKTVGRKWNMRHRYAADIRASCGNEAICNVSTIRLFKGNELNETFNVCGVHKNVIERRAKMFGWKIATHTIQGDPASS